MDLKILFHFLNDWNKVWTLHARLTRAVASLARVVYNFEKGIIMKVNIKGRRTPGNPEATYKVS